MVEREIIAALLLTSLIGIACPDPVAPVRAEESRTVIGPSNPELTEGAQALLAGDSEEGIRLTKIGLSQAANNRERTAGLSNLCAGYLQLDKPQQALGYCDEALEINDHYWRAFTNRAIALIKLGDYERADEDLQAAEALAPNARTVREARAMLRDAVDPVTPSIVIDDRRTPEN